MGGVPASEGVPPPSDGIVPRAHQDDLQRARRRSQARDRRARRPIDRPPRDRSDLRRRTSLPQAPNRATCPVATTRHNNSAGRSADARHVAEPRAPHHALAHPLRSHTGDRAAGRARTTSATSRSTRRSATSSIGTMRGRRCSDRRAGANRLDASRCAVVSVVSPVHALRAGCSDSLRPCSNDGHATLLFHRELQNRRHQP